MFRTFSSRALALLCAFLIATPAFAQERIIGGGVYTPVVSASYTGPGDITTFTAWWGFRAYSAAKASAGALAANIRNTSTNEQCDFPVVSSGGLGVAKNCTASSNGSSLATFCGSGCAVTEWYDQTGNGWNVVQATAADQPLVVLSGINSLPVLQTTNNSQLLATSSNFTPASGVVSEATVGERVTGSGNPKFIEENGSNMIRTNSAANTWTVSGSSGTINPTANDAAAHSVSAILNGASSVVNVDGSETTGTITGSTAAGTAVVSSGGGSTTQYEGEAGFIDNVAWSSTVRANLRANMKSYWGTP